MDVSEVFACIHRWLGSPEEFVAAAGMRGRDRQPGREAAAQGLLQLWGGAGDADDRVLRLMSSTPLANYGSVRLDAVSPINGTHADPPPSVHSSRMFLRGILAGSANGPEKRIGVDGSQRALRGAQAVHGGVSGAGEIRARLGAGGTASGGQRAGAGDLRARCGGDERRAVAAAVVPAHERELALVRVMGRNYQTVGN